MTEVQIETHTVPDAVFETEADVAEEPVPSPSVEDECKRDTYFAQRLAKLRAEVLKCDWTCDKYLTLPGAKGYPYMSSDKCRRNIAPLISKYGFEFVPEFSDLKREELYGNVTNHWSVKLRGTLYDAFTGRSITATVYGENGSSDDKGIIKAQTAAIKQLILCVFLLAVGLDADGPEVEQGGTFVRKEDAEEVRSKVLSQGVKPSEPAKPKKTVAPPAPPAPAKAPAKAPATLAKPTKPAEAPKVQKPAEPAPEPKEAPAEAPKEVSAVGAPELPADLGIMHRNGISKIIEKYTELAKEGKVTPEDFNAMSMACAEIKTKADAVNFIKKYQEV